MIEVIKMDQWSSTGNLDEWTYEQMKDTIENLKDGHAPAIEGGDAEAAQKIHGGRYAVAEVEDEETPPKGMVWYVEGDGGDLERYKTNFATK